MLNHHVIPLIIKHVIHVITHISRNGAPNSREILNKVLKSETFVNERLTAYNRFPSNPNMRPKNGKEELTVSQFGYYFLKFKTMT